MRCRHLQEHLIDQGRAVSHPYRPIRFQKVDGYVMRLQHLVGPYVIQDAGGCRAGLASCLQQDFPAYQFE